MSEPNKEIINNLIGIYNSKNFSKLIKTISILEEKYPNSIYLLNILGGVHSELKNFENAISCYQKIIKLNDNFYDAYYNLGITYNKINKIDKAIENYKKCIEFNPQKFEAYNNLGNIYLKKIDLKTSIFYYLKCLEINNNFEVALQNFGVCIKNYNFTRKNNQLDKHIYNLLTHEKIYRAVDIEKSIISYLYLDPIFSKIFTDYSKIDKKYSLEKLIIIISSNKVLLELLKVTPITDLKIEKFLCNLRSLLLINIDSIANKKLALKLIISIASQCFINDYIYLTNEKEDKYLNNLEKKISQGDLNSNILEIACLASYKPLQSYSWCNKVRMIKELNHLITQQILEPEEELKVKNKIDFKKIKNLISLNVKDQYESHPYPKWNKISLYNSAKSPLVHFNNIGLKFNIEKLSSWKKIDILIAGCGTGQHAITAATKFKNSFVTAIDLSVRSLCYAKRKSDELDIKNINFIQMDILELSKLKKKYHIIECVGVLHHMDNPFKGLEILNNILKPMGFMMLGLYSNFARKHIERIRIKIEKSKLKLNEENIKEFRKTIINSTDKDSKLITQSSDFYSLSSLRDLIFHVQEHRFTIPEISKYLEKLNLDFCGFENNEIINEFKVMFKRENDLYNLNLWHQFELKNQRMFAGMYQFWVQKNQIS